MAITLPTLPSLPTLPTQLPSASLTPAAVLNVVSLIAKNLPKINPPTPLYAIINADTGLPLTIPDSWGEMTLHFAEYQTTDYPIEAGGFMSANKVRRPDGVEVTLIKTGTDLARATWLEAIRVQIAADPIARYHILTPSGIYQSQTITRLSHQTRPDRGSNLLYLDLQLTEVPQITTPSLQGDNAVEPEAGPTQEVGRVYPSDASPQVASLAIAGASTGSPLLGA
ncbi:hypothetical protein [Xanthomonas phage XPP9]|uniref:Uncharacterized protein n=1 Tax=Xanthomonas phage XPV1 TaxID=2099860 RepID=A0A3S7I6B1_9CAUD|nr:hypothetical protein KEM12_gp28 [Xanthomonas phage XPV1]AVO24150.1 hypothetical protein [Xanthomonas phage XPP9]AVO24192.1 hypothetical protein [Xanthomonas phage XPV1]AVO24283.1 hypothetical protein [Xanthomonas phage XPV2]AVO24344.1 hypothetical protein [Xanthomonas phage XPV3]